jgi:hypothetical protein
VTVPSSDVPHPRVPVPVPACATCKDLAGQRDSARAEFDRSKEADANVLLRRHLRQEHRG